MSRVQLQSWCAVTLLSEKINVMWNQKLEGSWSCGTPSMSFKAGIDHIFSHLIIFDIICCFCFSSPHCPSPGWTNVTLKQSEALTIGGQELAVGQLTNFSGTLAHWPLAVNPTWQGPCHTCSTHLQQNSGAFTGISTKTLYLLKHRPCKWNRNVFVLGVWLPQWNLCSKSRSLSNPR